MLKLSIEGVNQTTAGGLFPPDTEGARGINHFVEVTNSHVDIYLKANGLRVKSVSLASFMGYFTRTLFDPRAVYDSTWNRWVITADAFPESATVRHGKDCLLPGGRQASKGGEVYVPKDAVKRVAEQSMEARIEERGMRPILVKRVDANGKDS